MPGFRSLHPFPAFLYFFCVTTLSMTLWHPTLLVVSLALLVALVFVLEPNSFDPKTFAAIAAIALCAGGILNPLFFHEGDHVFAEIAGVPFTWESVWYGLTLALSSVTMLFACFAFRIVVPSDRFLYLFSALWPRGALVAMMALRFVPLFLARLRDIADVQRTKGISAASGPYRARAANAMKLLRVLLVWSLEEALQTADAMKARGYGTAMRTAYAAHSMRRRDWLSVAYLGITFVVCVALRYAGDDVMAAAAAWEPLRLSRTELFLLAAVAGHVGFPLFVEGKEWAFWRLSR